jgi:hypothetical protein
LISQVVKIRAQYILDIRKRSMLLKQNLKLLLEMILVAQSEIDQSHA